MDLSVLVLVAWLAGAEGEMLAAAPAAPSTPGALSLREAIAEALQRSPMLEPARDAVDMAEIQRQLAQAQFASRVTPGFYNDGHRGAWNQRQIGLTVSKHLPTGTNVAMSVSALEHESGFSTVRDTGYTVSVAQSLLHAFGPALRAGTRMASRQVVSAGRQLALTKQELVQHVAEAYLGVVRLELLTEAAVAGRERAVRLRDASDARARVGLATQLDVLRADLLLSQSDAALNSHREAVEYARDALKLLIGRPLESAIVVDRSSLPPLSAHVPAEGEAVAAALARRLDVQDARDQVHDARFAESVARWSAWPDLRVTAAYTQRGLGHPQSAVFQDLLGGWRVGVSADYGLDRAGARAAVATTAIGTAAARRALDTRQQQVAAEVRAAVRGVERSREAIAIQEKAVGIAERQLRLAELRYERGLSGNFDVIDAEANLLDARSGLIAAEVDQALARLALERATGALDPEAYVR